MPAKSAKQYGMMAAIAHGNSNKKRAFAPSKDVAKEFVSKTPPKKRSEFMKALRGKR